MARRLFFLVSKCGFKRQDQAHWDSDLYLFVLLHPIKMSMCHSEPETLLCLYAMYSAWTSSFRSGPPLSLLSFDPQLSTWRHPTQATITPNARFSHSLCFFGLFRFFSSWGIGTDRHWWLLSGSVLGGSMLRRVQTSVAVARSSTA
jgi:hypothetical protein